MARTALITHADCRLHNMGDFHPENPARLRAIIDRLHDSGLMAELICLEARPAGDEPLLRVHTAQHVEQLRRALPASGLYTIDADTQLGPYSLQAARLAAGALLQAVDGVMAGEFRHAFCAVRPPGHHAESDQSMGFCLFNNIAVAAAHARAVWGIERLAIVDFDVHHGNGTVEIFQDVPQVMICSSFQHPFYPGRYTDLQRDHLLFSPLRAGSGGEAFRRQVEQVWLPALTAHQPELILVSAGFDAHRDDPLGGLCWVEQDYRWITDQLTELARRCAGGRLVAALEGGYHLAALAASVEAHVGALLSD